MYLSVDKSKYGDKVVIGSYHVGAEKLIDATVCHLKDTSITVEVWCDRIYMGSLRMKEGLVLAFDSYKSVKYDGEKVVLEL